MRSPIHIDDTIPFVWEHLEKEKIKHSTNKNDEIYSFICSSFLSFFNKNLFIQMHYLQWYLIYAKLAVFCQKIKLILFSVYFIDKKIKSILCSYDIAHSWKFTAFSLKILRDIVFLGYFFPKLLLIKICS